MTDNGTWNSPYGENWQKASYNPIFSDRGSHSSLASYYKTWAFGGKSFDTIYGNFGFRDDVWSSSDGTNWILESNFAWVPNLNGPNGLVFHNWFFLFGVDGNIVLNRTYSSLDGVSWALATDSGSLGLGDGDNLILFKNEMWSFSNKRTWHSLGGLTWIEEDIASGGWAAESFVGKMGIYD